MSVCVHDCLKYSFSVKTSDNNLMVIFSLTYILQEKVSKSCDLSLASTGQLKMASDCALISASMS